MRVHCLQHVPFEGPGSIGPWLEGERAEVTWTRPYEGEAFPDTGAVDWVIALGGPMSVNDEGTLPWLAHEKRFVREAIERGKVVLGICLGAQLIASALGARVYPNGEREIGWFPVERLPSHGQHPVADLFPQRTEVFHWHGETFDLPAGALHLARSEACENQAFAVGGRVVGLQFHLETTPEAARALVQNCAEELASAGPYVQRPASVLADPSQFRAINDLMTRLLAYLRKPKG